MPTHPPLYPLRFAPIFKSAIWGGRRIADYFPNAPKEGPISEVWLVSDVANNVSVIADGPLAGTTLRELMLTRRADLGLPHHETFPLLIKIIDAKEPLSVQVHPNDEQAQRLAGQPRGKTEAWYILHAEPGAKIYAGFKAGMDRTEFLKAFHAGRIEDTLHSFEAKGGDCIFIPAGTIHAAGAGLAIFEVQQTSDITYRLYDWGRVDSKTGKARQLHIDQALECLDFDTGPISPIRKNTVENDHDEKLMQCGYFEMWQTKEATGERIHTATRCRVLLCLKGATTARHAAVAVPVGPLDVVLVPPGETIHSSVTGVTFLDIWPL
jgi:mannose-6-phosphate isomerase